MLKLFFCGVVGIVGGEGCKKVGKNTNFYQQEKVDPMGHTFIEIWGAVYYVRRGGRR